jgi:hypothetical protein
MSDAWPKHFISPKEEPPEKIPWNSIESHERSRAVILKAMELGKLADAASLLAREWNIPSIKSSLERHIAETYGGAELYRAHLVQTHGTLPHSEHGDRTTDLMVEERIANPNEKWRFAPELNFAARELLAREDVSGLQIAQILLRIGKTPGHPTLDTIKKFIGQNGGREGAIAVLRASTRALPLETEKEIVHRVDTLRRLTPKKMMSPWLGNERARALAAILLSNPRIPMSVVVNSIVTHCSTGPMLNSAVRKPMYRWKSAEDEEDLDYEPRQHYAEALASDCEQFDSATYAEMAQIAKSIESALPKDTPPDLDAIKSAAWARMPLQEKLRQLRERIEQASQSFELGMVTRPTLTENSQEHLKNKDFSDLTQAIRERRSWSMPHISIVFSEQAYRAGGVIDTSLLVPAVTVNINPEGGTESSRSRAQLVGRYIREELTSQRKLTYTRNTALLDSMLFASQGRPPLFRFEWRDTSQAWMSRKRLHDLTDTERASRIYQMPLSRMNALTRPSAENS